MAAPSITGSPGQALEEPYRPPIVDVLKGEEAGTGPAPPADAEPTSRKRDLLEFMIVGGATLVLVPFSFLYQYLAGVDTSVYQVSYIAFYLAWVINDPHFAVSYLLFYKKAPQRALGSEFKSPVQKGRYWIAGVVVPVGLLVWAIVGFKNNSAQTLGLMFQFMFFLVGWHYVKQGFGCYAVLSARRGIKITDIERKTILTHCFSGWLYAWFGGFWPGLQYDENGVIYTSVNIPAYQQEMMVGADVLATLSLVVLLLSGVMLGYLLVRKAVMQGALPAIAPLGGLLISIWLWIIFSDFDPLVAYFIPALHSIQYLYFVFLLKRGEARAASGPPSFAGVGGRLAIVAGGALVLGMILFHGLPDWFDGGSMPIEVAIRAGQAEALSGYQSLVAELETKELQSALGFTPFLATITAMINIHHYFMDHVMWRRENPDTKFLRA